MKSDEIKAKAERYNRVERQVDSYARVIGVRRLKPSEQMKLTGLTADLDGFDEVIGEKGDVSHYPKRGPFIISAAVCEVDGIPFTFPKTRGELDAIFDRLDEEGLKAAGEAYSRLVGLDKPPGDTGAGIGEDGGASGQGSAGAEIDEVKN